MFSDDVSTPVSRSFANVQFSRNKEYDSMRQMSRSLASILPRSRAIEHYFEEQSSDDFSDFFTHDADEESSKSRCLSVIHLFWSLGLLLIYCTFINSGIKAYFIPDPIS